MYICIYEPLQTPKCQKVAVTDLILARDPTGLSLSFTPYRAKRGMLEVKRRVARLQTAIAIARTICSSMVALLADPFAGVHNSNCVSLSLTRERKRTRQR